MFFAAIVLLCTLFTGSSQKKRPKQIFSAIVRCDERACISAETSDLLRERPITSTCSIAFADQDFQTRPIRLFGRICGTRVWIQVYLLAPDEH